MIRRFPLRAVVAALAIASTPSLHAQQDVDPAAPPATTTAPDVASTRVPHDADLSADLFYRLLLGDVAMQRGDMVVAARAYLEAARSTSDSRLAGRATEVAIAARDRTLVRDAASGKSGEYGTSSRAQSITSSDHAN